MVCEINLLSTTKMLSQVKPKMSPLINALARPFLKVNANVLTLIGLIPPVLFMFFMQQHNYWVAMICFVGILLDTIDGAVSRITKTETKFGALLDSTIDRIADTLFILGFYYAGIVRLEVVLVALVLSYIISYIRSKAELAGKATFSLNIGIIERPERMVFLVVALFVNIVSGSTQSVEFVFLVLIALSLITIAQRLHKAYELLK